MPELYLIDGNSYVYRAFHAIKGLTTSRGLPTNAVFGFTKMLLKIIQTRKPEAMAIAFDSPAPTKRHKLYAEYKSQRPETPDSLLLQIPYIRRLVNAMHIKTYEIQGLEADDILAVIALQAAGEGIEVFIVTADKDMLQVVSDRIKIYDPVKDRVIDRDQVIQQFGVPPERIPEVMALTGDSIDNIPGVRGIGEKTAKQLLSRYTLTDLLENPDLIDNARIKKAIQEHRDEILMSLRLARLDVEPCIEFSYKDCILREPDWSALLRLFKELEFGSLLKIIPATVIEKPFQVINSMEDLSEVLTGLSDKMVLNSYYVNSHLLGLAINSYRGNVCWIPLENGLMFSSSSMAPERLKRLITGVLKERNLTLVGHNLKEAVKFLLLNNENTTTPLQDIMIASWLINPNRAEYDIATLSLEFLDIKIPDRREILKPSRKSPTVPDTGELKGLICTEMAVLEPLREEIFKRLKEEGLWDVYEQIEMPLISVLATMEKWGIKVDLGLLNRLSWELNILLEDIQKRIFELCGREFNLNSPRQLSRVLFEDLGLKPLRKTKTGFSTDMNVLQELAREHPVPREILNWRLFSKLKSTYVDALIQMVNPNTGRVHTTFNQTGTSTGRISSSEPNLQNIPVRGEWGEKLRKVFVAEQGWLLLSADYSQIELRILAHLCGEEKLKRAFKEGRDIHKETAMELFNVPEEELHQDMRRLAKTVNFGVVYGISAFGLSDATGTTVEEARKYIQQYFESYPAVKAYTDRVVEEARRLGYVRTIMGRKRPVPELFSPVASERTFGERVAINTPVQGSAADIIKLAMINIQRRIHKEGLSSRLLLQVHDELLFEVPERECEYMMNLVREEMESVVELSVPIRVEIGTGRNWSEAHT